MRLSSSFACVSLACCAFASDSSSQYLAPLKQCQQTSISWDDDGSSFYNITIRSSNTSTLLQQGFALPTVHISEIPHSPLRFTVIYPQGSMVDFQIDGVGSALNTSYQLTSEVAATDDDTCLLTLNATQSPLVPPVDLTNANFSTDISGVLNACNDVQFNTKQPGNYSLHLLQPSGGSQAGSMALFLSWENLLPSAYTWKAALPTGGVWEVDYSSDNSDAVYSGVNMSIIEGCLGSGYELISLPGPVAAGSSGLFPWSGQDPVNDHANVAIGVMSGIVLLLFVLGLFEDRIIRFIKGRRRRTAGLVTDKREAGRNALTPNFYIFDSSIAITPLVLSESIVVPPSLAVKTPNRLGANVGEMGHNREFIDTSTRWGNPTPIRLNLSASPDVGIPDTPSPTPEPVDTDTALLEVWHEDGGPALDAIEHPPAYCDIRQAKAGTPNEIDCGI